MCSIDILVIYTAYIVEIVQKIIQLKNYIDWTSLSIKTQRLFKKYELFRYLLMSDQNVISN